MGNLPATTFLDLLAHPRLSVRPQVFVELGTFEGKTAALATKHFPVVHTVEMSEHYYTLAGTTYPHLGIHFHLGDSRAVLRVLAQQLSEPVCWYHDAHWWPYPEVERSFPLWDDLATLAARPYPDIVIVDEVHRFGDVKPTVHWQTVSLARIASHFPGARAAEVQGNMAVVYR